MGKLLKTKFCKGKEREILKSIQNTNLPRYILDFKARLILGKTKSNSQLAHWTNEYTSQACFMCQFNGDFELATLMHTLYECPKAQNTIDYICQELNLQKNIKPHEVILTTAQCTSNLGKHPKDEDFHNVCGALNNYRDNSTGNDYIWATVCQYFFIAI